MSISNTPDKTIISSNFSTFSLMTNEERRMLKKAQSVQLDSMDPEVLEQGTEGILQQYITESGNDATLVTQAFEALTNLRSQGGYETLLETPQLLTIMADMVDKGLA